MYMKVPSLISCPLTLSIIGAQNTRNMAKLLWYDFSFLFSNLVSNDSPFSTYRQIMKIVNNYEMEIQNSMYISRLP